MTKTELNRALQCATAAARAVGAILRRNLTAPKQVNDSAAHDVKLELDVRCQRLIERTLHRAFPDITLLGEEGEQRATHGPQRWVVDPIDGTVNFSHGIPHACICIALQERSRSQAAQLDQGYRTILGVVYDPFLDELWDALDGGPARLNGRRIRVSRARRLRDSVVAMGFGKNAQSVRKSLRLFSQLSVKAQKVRNMGVAGLAMVYVASGRFDAYIEQGISLWDVAAGGFILERAGGEYWRQPGEAPLTYRMIASNGHLRSPVQGLRP
ncbi:MAG: inositol monophosphatase [Verrucomicrobia bacterium]|jgi:myo-inositol-1(or 4)-monophosphatase|nr:inositol monophosphatase [Verrucomicrobiota bacterium]